MTTATPPLPGVTEGFVRGRGTSWRRISIISKLALLVLAVGLPLVAILAWSMKAQFDLGRELAQQRAVSHALAVAIRVEAIVGQTRSILQALALRPGVIALDRQRCDPFLDELRAAMPHYANLNTFNLRWEFVCTASPARGGGIVRTAYPELYERMRARDDMVFSAPVHGQLTGRLVVIAAYPMHDAAGRLLGAVTAPIEVAVLAGILSSGDRDIATQLTDASGAVVVRSTGGKHAGALELTMLSHDVGHPGVSIAVDRSGIERIHARVPVKGTDWVATAALPVAEFMESRQQHTQTVAAVLLAFALAAWVALILARRITRPLRELERDARTLAGGNFGHRSAVEGPDEVGQLAAAFNDMGRAVQQHEAVILRGIAERERSDRQIRRLNRVHAVLTGINALIVRVQGRDELFREACRVAVEAGAFRMAWIGMLDPGTLEGRVVALHGGEDFPVDLLRLTGRAGLPEGDRPACRALREAAPVICNDIAADPGLAELREELLARGHRSLGCFPLRVGGRVEGVMALFAGEAGAFDADEMRLLLGLSDDISFALDHFEKQDRLDYLAYYDALTGLANRTLFLERVGQALGSAASGGHELALFLMDLEHFKNINDSLGRPAGDALLQQVAGWLAPAAGAANLVARVGADQFAVILPKVKAAGSLAHFVERRSSEFAAHPFSLDDAVFRVAIKVGVAVYPEDGVDAETLFRNAEAALKKAKATGERYLFHTPQMTETVAGQLTLENALRQALERGEFVLHYQPKVSLATGRLTGAEALVRWNDPRTGPVPPEVFLPVLEETGLIVEVGRWALRQAVEDFLRWKGQGLAVRVAVKVSRLQLRHRGFLAEVEEMLALDESAAGGLELEIAEGVVMEDVKHSIATLAALRAMGVHVAIDDFGTGLSSLRQLARLPADTLKVERSFVTDMTTGPKGLALVSTIIRLAHSLRLQVVAQGVETEEQSRLLALLGCDAAQGALVGAPLPAAEFVARFLRDGRP